MSDASSIVCRGTPGSSILVAYRLSISKWSSDRQVTGRTEAVRLLSIFESHNVRDSPDLISATLWLSHHGSVRG